MRKLVLPIAMDNASAAVETIITRHLTAKVSYAENHIATHGTSPSAVKLSKRRTHIPSHAQTLKFRVNVGAQQGVITKTLTVTGHKSALAMVMTWRPKSF